MNHPGMLAAFGFVGADSSSDAVVQPKDEWPRVREPWKDTKTEPAKKKRTRPKKNRIADIAAPEYIAAPAYSNGPKAEEKPKDMEESKGNSDSGELTGAWYPPEDGWMNAVVLGGLAGYNWKQRKGTLLGQFGYNVPMLPLTFPYPLSPLLNLRVSLVPSLFLRADLGGELQQATEKDKTVTLTGLARAEASLSGMIKAGITIGLKPIWSIDLDAFADIRVDGGAQMQLSGTLQQDPDGRRLTESDSEVDRAKAAYELNAGVFVHLGLSGQGSHFNVKKNYLCDGNLLFKYTWKEWELGHYEIKGVLGSKQGGGVESLAVSSGFNTATGEPNPPGFKLEPVPNARDILLEKGLNIPGSGPERLRILNELSAALRANSSLVFDQLDASTRRYIDAQSRYDQQLATAGSGGGGATDTGEARLQNEVARAKEEMDRWQKEFRRYELVMCDCEQAKRLEGELETGDVDLAGLEERIRAR